MRRSVCLLIVFLLATSAATQACRPTPQDVSTATPVPNTEPPAPTSIPTATEAPPTEEPSPTSTVEPTEPEPSPTPTAEPTEPEPSSTPTPEPEEPTATAPPPSPTVEPAEPEGLVLLEERCTVCHALDRVERAQKTQEEWVSTVDRMVSYGAQLSEAEMEVLIDYLAETYGP